MITLKPPFRAEDMHSLFKVVLKGVYPKISNKYSTDLQKVVKTLIQVNPKKRPTCDDILNLDQIKKRDTLTISNNEGDVEAEQPNILLQTIYVPKNLMFLTDSLPRPKYENTSTSSIYGGSDTELKSK